MSNATTSLQAMERGEEQYDAEQLLSVVYDELRMLAAARMARESEKQTLQPTALVHEAWLRLTAQNCTWQNRAHFFGAAAEAMRRILIEKARSRSSQKHGGNTVQVDWEKSNLFAAIPDDHVLLVDEALEHLEKLDPEKARIVVLKFFGGLTNLETAEALGSSKRTVDRQWMAAKVWLYQYIRTESVT